MRKIRNIRGIMLLSALAFMLTMFYFSERVMAEDTAVRNADSNYIALDAAGAEAQKVVIRQILSLQDKITYIEVKDPEVMPSLFFLDWQHALIREFKEGTLVRLPRKIGGGGAAAVDTGVVRDPGIRELSLGGIAYVSANDWTIWFNGVRLKPDSLPLDVLYISVTAEYVDLKWYDPYTEVIFPVRIRPHQRFNLDSRLFLTGHITSTVN